MRQPFTAKPFLAAALAAVMALNITAFAAPEGQTAPSAAVPAATEAIQQGYRVQVLDGQLQFIKNGQVVRTVDLKSASLLLTKSKDGGVAIQVVDSTGKARKFTLGAQSQVEIGGQLDSVTLSPTLPASSAVSIAKEAKVRSLTVRSAGRVDLAGEVTSLEVTNAAAQVTVTNTASVAQISSVSGSAVKGVSASQVKVTAGQGSSSSASRQDPEEEDSRRPSSGGSSSNSGSNSGSRPQQQNAILRVETQGSSLVRVTMKQQVKLSKEDFSILCTGGGKDMTILSVSTQDDRVYELRTAQYFDNTYNLQVTLPDGRRVDKDFEVKIMAVEITSQEMTRKDAGTAEFFYLADEDGAFYYLLQEKSLLRGLWNKPQEPTVEELLAQGTMVPMAFRENTVSITGLKADTAYTMYYLAKDSLGRVTPIHYADIDAKPQQDTGSQGAITIQKLEAKANNSTEFIEVHNYFVVTLSQATQQPLTGSSFTLRCARGDIPLEPQVKTDDNRVYTVDVKAGHMLRDARFTMTVTFPDGTTASASTTADSSAPILTGIGLDWRYDVESEITSNSAIQLQLSANEPGYLYYVVLPDEDSFHDSSPKDPQRIIKHPDVVKLELQRGSSVLSLPYYPKGGEEYLCFVAEDEMGNTQNYFWYEKLPAYNPPQQPGEGGGEGGDGGETPGEPEKPKGSMEFIKTETVNAMGGDKTKISFRFDPIPVSFSRDYVTIKAKKGTVYQGYRGIPMSEFPDGSGEASVTVSEVLAPDTYTLTYNDGDLDLSFQFTIE